MQDKQTTQSAQTAQSALWPEKWALHYWRAMYNYAYMRTGDSHTAQDIVQDTFLSALSSQQGFKGLSSEKTWLYSILKHRIIDHYRRRGRSRIVTYSSLAKYSPEDNNDGSWIENVIEDGSVPSPEEKTETEEFLTLIDDCLSRLPERQAAVFRMKSIEDIPAEQICSALGITAANYWVLLHRARAGLKECIKSKWFNV